MAAIKTALDVNNELYIMTHTYEVALGAIYLLFILSIGQRVFLTFLPRFRSPEIHDPKLGNLNLEEEFESYEGFFRNKVS